MKETARIKISIETATANLDTTMKWSGGDTLIDLAYELERIQALVREQDPYTCLLGLIDQYIKKSQEKPTSLAIIKIDNYLSICEELGINQASTLITEVIKSLSTKINIHHKAVRISEMKTALLFDQSSKQEVISLLDHVVANFSKKLTCSYKVVTYPEDGSTPEELIFLAYV